MTKNRPGFHSLFAQIPEALWLRLEADAQAKGVSATRLLTDLLARHYKISAGDLPKPKKAGPKPKPQ